MEQVAEIKAVISLPEESFNAYGAMVKTSLCIFRKLGADEAPNPNSESLLIEAENLGYDATGRAKKGTEVQDIIDLFHKEIGW